jgi:hypothetical protein
MANDIASAIALPNGILRDTAKNKIGIEGNIVMNINSTVNKKGLSTISL